MYLPGTIDFNPPELVSQMQQFLPNEFNASQINLVVFQPTHNRKFNGTFGFISFDSAFFSIRIHDGSIDLDKQSH